MTDLNLGFGSTPQAANPSDSQVLSQNIDRSSFDAAVQAEVARQLRAQGAGDTSDFNAPAGPVHTARNHYSDEHYGGMVSQELIDAAGKSRDGSVLAVQRSIVKNKFGERINVWFPAPEYDGVSPIPGEYRRVYLEKQEEEGTSSGEGFAAKDTSTSTAGTGFAAKDGA